MCKVKETPRYRMKKSEILSDKNLKEVVETKFSEMEKEIENKWREINKKEEVGAHKNNEDNLLFSLQNYYRKTKNKIDKFRKDREFIKHPRVIEIDDKQQIEVYLKYEEKKRAVDIDDLVFLETYKPKFRYFIYIYYFFVGIAIIYMLAMRSYFSNEFGNKVFFLIYLSVYIGIVCLGIKEKKSRSIFWRNKNEPKVLSFFRLFFLQDSDINSNFAFIYILINFTMLLMIDYKCIANITGIKDLKLEVYLISSHIIFLSCIVAMFFLFCYLLFSGAMLIQLGLIILLSVIGSEAWQGCVLIFGLIEWVLTKDFWQLMPEESVPKFIKNPSDKINMIISRNLNEITIIRLLCYVVIYISLYLSDKINLVERVITKEQVGDSFLIGIGVGVVNKSLFIAIAVFVSWLFSKCSLIKIMIKIVKGNIYDKIYRDTIEYSSVSPSIIKKVELSISHVDKIAPKLLVKNMEDLPKETTVFIEKVNKSKKTCNVVVVMPDLTIHRGIVEFEP